MARNLAATVVDRARLAFGSPAMALIVIKAARAS